MTKLVTKKKGLLFLILFMLNGCAGNDKQDRIKQYIKNINARPPQAIEPIPNFKPLPAYKYPEHAARRNPFKPISEPNRNKNYAPNIHRKRQVLEQFPLDALKFVGILQQSHRVWGLIKTPNNGEIKRVKSGDYMGRNYGKIKQINPDFITLEERVKIGELWKKTYD